MKCPKCHYNNPDEANFCMKCAHPLQAIPPSPIDLTRPHSYTPKFLADKILTSRSAMEGERKHVTVLFADVAGFTSISEKLDPEQVHQIMDGCFKIMMDEIHSHHGTINQFTGDGVMALFGAPLALENHAQNACQAALAIQNAIKNYSEEVNKKYGFDFKMRIGLNTGPVIVGSIGDDLRMDYTAIGDTTNLAARMESMAEPGTIMVSSETYKRISQQFDFQPLGRTEVKGKKNPLDVYVLIKEKIDRPRLGIERQIFSEMVGRDKEINKLESQINTAINGDGSVVNIIGEAGIGKSRLITELKERDIVKRIKWIEGRAISIGRNLSFHPIINLLKNWAKIKDEDSLATSQAKLESVIRNICQKDTDEIFPFVATLMGMKLEGRHAERVKGIEGEALEKLIFKNVRDFLIKSTELTPLVIVIEDLHWADTSSIELLESLFRLAEKQRILFVNVFRPNHPETGDRIIESIKEKLPLYYIEINLQPLNDQMSETLINNMLNIGGLKHAIVHQIIQRAGGNPFFIEEVVRSFIDEGAVVRTNGEFRVTEKIEKMVIPQTINDVLTARIDRLDENTRDLIKVASVIGRSFFYRILIEVATAIDGIDSRLSYLKQIELIRERRRMEELEYLFKHALAQEAAYESILQQKRKELHKSVADSIEKVFSERLYEFYGMLAFHYSQAEDLDKTEEYLIKAGEESLRTSASAEALHYCQQALDLYLRKAGDKTDPKKVSMLEKNIALALYNRGQYAECIAYFDKALTLYGARIPRHKITKVLKLGAGIMAYISAIYFPFLYWNKEPSQEDNEFFNLDYKKCAALSVTDPDEWFFRSFYFMIRFTKIDFTKIDTGPGFNSIGVVLFALTGLSFTLSRRVLTFTKNKINAADVRSMFFYQCNVLIHSVLSGEWTDKIEIDQKLVDKNIAIGEFFYVTVYMSQGAIANIIMGDFITAHGKIQQLCNIAETYENDFARVCKFFINGFYLINCRRLNETINECEEGILFTERTGFRVWLICLHSIKASAQMLLGDYNAAEDSFELAEKILAEMPVVPMHVAFLFLNRYGLHVYKLEESLKKFDNQAAKKCRSEAMLAATKALKTAKKYSPIKIETFKIMGEYLWLIGKQSKAMKWWRKAVSGAQYMKYHPELSRTYFEIGKRLLESNSKYKELNGINAEEYLNKAKTMFEEMDLQWDLDELDKVRAAK